jgi:hypothetical protein
MVDSKRWWSRVIWGPYTEDLKEAVHTICLRCLHPSAAWLLVRHLAPPTGNRLDR